MIEIILEILHLGPTVLLTWGCYKVYKGTKRYADTVSDLRRQNYELEHRVRSLEDTIKDIEYYFRDLK